MTDGVVLDSSILIDFRRRHSSAWTYVTGLVKNGVALTHPVCAAELLVGAFDRADLKDTQRFLQGFPRTIVKPADVEHCLSLVAQYRLSHGIGWPDCLLAATCTRLRLPLATLNDKHFGAIRGLRVIRPY